MTIVTQNVMLNHVLNLIQYWFSISQGWFFN